MALLQLVVCTHLRRRSNPLVAQGNARPRVFSTWMLSRHEWSYENQASATVRRSGLTTRTAIDETSRLRDRSSACREGCSPIGTAQTGLQPEDRGHQRRRSDLSLNRDCPLAASSRPRIHAPRSTTRIGTHRPGLAMKRCRSAAAVPVNPSPPRRGRDCSNQKRSRYLADAFLASDLLSGNRPKVFGVQITLK